MEHTAEVLLQEIESLTPEQALRVEALSSSMRADDPARNPFSLSEPAFGKVWNDPENDIYDSV